VPRITKNTKQVVEQCIKERADDVFEGELRWLAVDGSSHPSLPTDQSFVGQQLQRGPDGGPGRIETSPAFPPASMSSNSR
jgi:hypothetical protein